jgi:predicted DNA-binding protein
MRKRTVPIQVFLSDKEAERLKQVVAKSGCTLSAYVRSLINGYIPTDLPPPDYHSMMNELRAIGNNMNQIAQKAHVLNVIDSKRYDDAFKHLKEAIVEIVNAVNRPRKIERKIE